MLCKQCVHWTVELFTYEKLEEKWDTLLGTKITPGYEDKFLKESKRLSRDFSETELPFKYCNNGYIDRFYIMRNPNDAKPKKNITSCAFFSVTSASATEFPVPGPLWNFCSTESHGPTLLRGQMFLPGLYENTLYFRIPTHNNVQPEIGVQGRCSVCCKDFEHGIMIHEITHFCCNRHYLQWWQERNPKIFEKLNRSR